MLSKALFGDTRRAVLALLYGNPGNAYYLRQITRIVDCGQGAVHRELQNLAAAGILRRTRSGREVYYQADPGCPVFEELKGLVRKTAGLVEILLSALESMEDRIRAAFVYGSFAEGTERPGSDIDVMIVGDVQFSDVARAIQSAQEALGREINPTVYPVEEFIRKTTSNNYFVDNVLERKKLFLIGNEDELKRLARKPLAE